MKIYALFFVFICTFFLCLNPSFAENQFSPTSLHTLEGKTLGKILNKNTEVTLKAEVQKTGKNSYILKIQDKHYKIEQLSTGKFFFPKNFTLTDYSRNYLIAKLLLVQAVEIEKKYPQENLSVHILLKGLENNPLPYEFKMIILKSFLEISPSQRIDFFQRSVVSLIKIMAINMKQALEDGGFERYWEMPYAKNSSTTGQHLGNAGRMIITGTSPYFHYAWDYHIQKGGSLKSLNRQIDWLDSLIRLCTFLEKSPQGLNQFKFRKHFSYLNNTGTVDFFFNSLAPKILSFSKNIKNTSLKATSLFTKEISKEIQKHLAGPFVGKGYDFLKEKGIFRILNDEFGNLLFGVGMLVALPLFVEAQLAKVVVIGSKSSLFQRFANIFFKKQLARHAVESTHHLTKFTQALNKYRSNVTKMSSGQKKKAFKALQEQAGVVSQLLNSQAKGLLFAKMAGAPILNKLSTRGILLTLFLTLETLDGCIPRWIKAVNDIGTFSMLAEGSHAVYKFVFNPYQNPYEF